MSLHVVAGKDTKEFALATIDYEILAARTYRDHWLEQADRAVLGEAPFAEHIALKHAAAATVAMDQLLEHRYHVAGQAAS